MIGMVDIKKWLNKEKHLEDLRDSIKTGRKDLDKITV